MLSFLLGGCQYYYDPKAFLFSVVNTMGYPVKLRHTADLISSEGIPTTSKVAMIEDQHLEEGTLSTVPTTPRQTQTHIPILDLPSSCHLVRSTTEHSWQAITPFDYYILRRNIGYFDQPN